MDSRSLGNCKTDSTISGSEQIPCPKARTSKIEELEEGDRSPERRKIAIIVFGVIGFFLCPCSLPILAFLSGSTSLGVGIFLFTNNLLLGLGVAISLILALFGGRFIFKKINR
ncbi:MAG: hypothetical protein ACFFC7_13475 [Candidatus Hermodarchaeota archaeon]